MCTSKRAIIRIATAAALWLASGVVGSCRAFITKPETRRRMFCFSKIPQHCKPPSRRSLATKSRLEMTPPTTTNDSKNFASLYEFNRELDRLAELCGNSNKQNENDNTFVVSCAADCEALYHEAPLGVDVVSFNTVLKAWNRVAGTMQEQQHAAIRNYQQEEDFQASALSLPVPVYTPRDAAARATKLLVDMESRVVSQNNETSHGHLVVPDRTSYNIVIDAWAKSHVSEAPRQAEKLLQQLKKHQQLQPDTLSYNCVLQAWVDAAADTSDAHALDHMQQLYQEMKSSSNSSGVNPTIRTVNTMIRGYAKRIAHVKYDNDYCQELAVKAHDLLNDMQKQYNQTGDSAYLPDVSTYTSVMDAYGKGGTVAATLKAQELLQELELAYATTQDERLKPNYRAYTAMIVAWSNVAKIYPQAPQLGQALLEKMELLGQDTSSNVKPNARSYTAAIQCWAKSRDPLKAQHALRILKKVRDNYKENNGAKPNLFVYNAAMDSCARCQGTTAQQTEALKIAFAMLKSLELEKDLRPNHVTYAILLKAVASLLPSGPERNSVASAVFAKCQKAGMVEESTLKSLRMAMDNQEITSLFKDYYDDKGKVQFEKLPWSWKKNVV